MKKLVKESLYENANIAKSQILETAKKLEKLLGIKLISRSEFDYLGYEYQDDEEANGIVFDVVDPKLKQIEDYPLILCLDERGGFQFWEESSPMSTSLNTEGEKRQMWQSLIAAPAPAEDLTPEIYQEIVDTYKNSLENIA